MTGVVGEPSGSHEFFGSSSAGSFMRQMQRAIDSRLGVGNDNAGAGIVGVISADGLSVTQRPFSTKPSIEYVLPPRKTADELVHSYWELVYPLYPFLDRDSFQRFYESVWTGSGPGPAPDESVLLCTMNVIFALGTQVSGTIEPEQRWEKAYTYFLRADHIREHDLRDNGSVSLVSCLLLMGIYLQSANIPQRCWMVVGHAIRMAQSLGLHLPDYNAPGRSLRGREVVRRIWHGCILMDRVLAMTFGRPAMIPKWLSAVVPLPSMIDDEFLDLQVEGSSIRPDNEPCIMEFYVSQLKLHDIMDNILLKLYMDHGGRQHPDVVTVFKLDEDLMNWTAGLSAELQLDAPLKHRESVRHRLAVVNRVRFFHARILLLRPILAQFCLSHHAVRPIESLASRMDIQCSSLCLETAHRSIDLIYSHLNQDMVFGPVPAWWYSVLYVYTAATVLLAERIRPEIGTTIAQYSNVVSWRRAIQILKAYARIGTSAKRCVAALEILSAKIPAAHSSELLQADDADPTVCTEPANPVPFPDSDLFSRVDLDGIFLDLDDMGWLQSGPEAWRTSMN
ncbi:fungal specific transcription factor domain-containing protein [Aspergillus melleus]|uniref:fungal specific transcription factor domain-containing protein n=1 Tax=Aspergillus melleus TaxID=138277 RepID=UPI001E8CCE3F|nr:uncharacterized protein LDX57_012279 [Aspergillus melleus]KAH8434637.1 hypothetical protein LDX57_012279 [Aspergillus melleus]